MGLHVSVSKQATDAARESEASGLCLDGHHVEDSLRMFVGYLV